jgi:hypothetical protein
MRRGVTTLLLLAVFGLQGEIAANTPRSSALRPAPPPSIAPPSLSGATKMVSRWLIHRWSAWWLGHHQRKLKNIRHLSGANSLERIESQLALLEMRIVTRLIRSREIADPGYAARLGRARAIDEDYEGTLQTLARQMAYRTAQIAKYAARVRR